MPVKLIVRSALLTSNVNILSADKIGETLLDLILVSYAVVVISFKPKVVMSNKEPDEKEPPLMVGEVRILFVNVSAPLYDTRVAPLTAALS